MAIVSRGFAGKLTAADWPVISEFLGHRPSVVKGGVTVSVVSGADRTVRVTPGTVWGYGIHAVSDANVDIHIEEIPSTSRHDTIIAKYDYAAKTTTLTYRTGGASAQVAGGLVVNPGVVVEQPLYLVKVVNGEQEPTQIVNLKEYATWSGPRRFASTAARDYWWPDPDDGDLAYIDDQAVVPDIGLTEYKNGSWRLHDTGWVSLSLAPGMAAQGGGPAVRRCGRSVMLRGKIKRADDTDIFSNVTLATIPADPPGLRPFAGINPPVGTAPKTAGSAAEVSINAAGTITSVFHVAVGWVSLDGISYFVD